MSMPMPPRSIGLSVALLLACRSTVGDAAIPPAPPRGATEPTVEETPERETPRPAAEAPVPEPTPPNPCAGLAFAACRGGDGCTLETIAVDVELVASGAGLRGWFSGLEGTGYQRSRESTIEGDIGRCIGTALRRRDDIDPEIDRRNAYTATVSFRLRTERGMGRVSHAQIDETDFPHPDILQTCLSHLEINFMGGGVAANHKFPPPKTTKHRGSLQIARPHVKCVLPP